MMKKDRRGFILSAFTGIGAAGALYAMKRTGDPLPSVQHAGVTTIYRFQSACFREVLGFFRADYLYVHTIYTYFSYHNYQ